MKLVINQSLEELFYSIENSKLYKEYKKMEDILSKDSNIRTMIDEIKELEKMATMLEESGDLEYKNIDKMIEEKSHILESNPIYQEYMVRMNELNEELANSSYMINSYIDEKVNG